MCHSYFHVLHLYTTHSMPRNHESHFFFFHDPRSHETPAPEPYNWDDKNLVKRKKKSNLDILRAARMITLVSETHDTYYR